MKKLFSRLSERTKEASKARKTEERRAREAGFKYEDENRAVVREILRQFRIVDLEVCQMLNAFKKIIGSTGRLSVEIKANYRKPAPSVECGSWTLPSFKSKHDVKVTLCRSDFIFYFHVSCPGFSFSNNTENLSMKELENLLERLGELFFA